LRLLKSTWSHSYEKSESEECAAGLKALKANERTFGSGFSREEVDAVSGTGRAGVRG
jgi:hypothetical protein